MIVAVGNQNAPFEQSVIAETAQQFINEIYLALNAFGSAYPNNLVHVVMCPFWQEVQRTATGEPTGTIYKGQIFINHSAPAIAVNKARNLVHFVELQEGATIGAAVDSLDPLVEDFYNTHPNSGLVNQYSAFARIEGGFAVLSISTVTA